MAHKHDTAVIILGHGSPVAEANRILLRVASSIRERGNFSIVQPAFLQFAHPDLKEAIDTIVKRGKKRVVIHPYFLYMGAHVLKDLPREIQRIKDRHPATEITLAKNLGYHEKIVETAVERIEEAMGHICEARGKRSGINERKDLRHPMPGTPYTFQQHPIEEESFRIIGDEIDESKFSPLELPIVKRVIHATADFDFAENLIFSEGAIERAFNSINRGRDIITDVRMVEAGIIRTIVLSHGGEVWCFSRDRAVAEMAKKEGITRASASMRKAAELMDGSIVVIGNAPTALSEVITMAGAGKAKPSLIIGVPPGFVGAVESKERLIREGSHYITCRGRKGGSTVAVAIINALLILAERKESSTGVDTCTYLTDI